MSDSQSRLPFAVIYRWRLVPGKEEQFAEGWRRITESIRARCGSGGSCLHRGPDGIWVAYARWPSSEARDECFAEDESDVEGNRMVRDAIAESLDATKLDVVCDRLALDEAAR